MNQVVEVVRSQSFRDAVHQLPGYDATDTGKILTLAQAFGGNPARKTAAA